MQITDKLISEVSEAAQRLLHRRCKSVAQSLSSMKPLEAAGACGGPMLIIYEVMPALVNAPVWLSTCDRKVH